MARIATLQAKNGARAGKTGGQSRASSSANRAAEVQQLAYQFFVDRGYQHGFDQEDWIRAEAIVKKKYS